MKLDNIFDLPCECGLCAEEELYFECPGCLRDAVPYCQGGSEEDYSDFCTPCYWQLSNDLYTVVIQLQKPNIYINN